MIILKDDMKKESKIYLKITVTAFILTIIVPSIIFFTSKDRRINGLFLSFFLFFFLLFFFFLIAYLSSIKYKIEINEVNIIIYSLFSKKKIKITDILRYDYLGNGHSIFHQFRLYTKDKILLIFTRYKDEFIQIIEEHRNYW